jgi:hypothetical protein
MAMQTASITVSGFSPLLLNNPQTVDRFNTYARQMKSINDKKTRRTDDDYLELRKLELSSKIYFDKEVGVYAPSTWLSESIACSAFSTVKVGRDKIRGALFVVGEKMKLKYEGQDKVKAMSDIVLNTFFHKSMALPQGQVRVVKVFPIFHDWSFSSRVEFDDAIIDLGMLKRVCESAGKYVGFGDMRPTFGRAKVEVQSV